MQWLKQSTAVTLKIGPFVDEDDGKTAETGLTISQADVRLSKNGGNIAQKNESTSCTHDEIGIYGCPIDATDTDTLGRLQLFVHESGALPVWHEFMVVAANVWDSLFGADYLQVDTIQVSGDATAADNLELQYDTTGLIGATFPATQATTDAILVDTGTTLPAEHAALPAANADAVWDEALADHDVEDSVGNVLNDLTEEADGTYRFTSAALIQAPTIGSPGAGAIEFTYTLTSSIDSNPIVEASVWVTSDLQGTTILASGTTDINGEVVFYLDSGTIYVWRAKSGWNFDNPDTEVVS